MGSAFQEVHVLSLAIHCFQRRTCPLGAKQVENVALGLVELRTCNISRSREIDRNDFPNATRPGAHDRYMRSKRQSLVDPVRHENDGALMFLPDEDQFRS